MSSKINIINTTNSVTITPLSTNNVDTNIINTPVTVTQGGANRVEILNNAKIGDSITLTNITASGDISASGNITVGNIGLGKLNPSIIEIEHDHNSSNLAGIAFVNGPNPPNNDIGFIRHRETGDNGQMEFATSDNGNGYGADHFIFGSTKGGTNIINFKMRPWFKIQGDYQNRPTAIISGALELITGYSGTPGNIKASGDISATNITASGEVKIDNPLYTGDLRIYQQNTNRYRLVSNIGVALEIGPDNVLRTAQRIQGTRGMHIKTYLGSDSIRFRDYDDNNIILVDHSGSLTLGNSSAHEPSVIINTDITASGDISASNDIHAQNFILSTNSLNPGKLVGSQNSANKYFQLEDGGGHAKLGVYRGFKFVTNEGGASQKVFFGLNEIRITNANLNVYSPITASGDISASGKITANGGVFRGDVSMGPQGNAGFVAKDDSGNNFTLSLRDTTPSMVFNDQTGTVGRGEIEFIGQAASSQSDFVFNATSGSHGEPATYQFQLQGEEVVRFTTGGISGSGLSISGSARNVIQGDAGFRLAGDNNNIFLESDGRTLIWQANNSARLQINSHDGGNNDSYIWFSHSENNDIKNVSAGTSQASGSFIIARDEGFGTNLDFVITGSNGFIGINEPNPTERLSVKGSIIASGSVRTTVVDITPPITTTTASLDCSLSNMFTLTLSSSNNIHLTSSNITSGQSISLRITQPVTSGSLTYDDTFKFPNGAPYEVSATHSVEDIVSFISFDSTTLYGSSLKNFE